MLQSTVPKVAPEPKLPPKGAAGGIATAAAASAAAVGGAGFGAAAAGGSDGGAAAAAAQYEALIKSRPEFAAMGKLFRSSAPVRCVHTSVLACRGRCLVDSGAGVWCLPLVQPQMVARTVWGLL